MNVADLMTSDPLHVSVETDIDSAVRLMDAHGVRHLPVLDGGRFVGIVSDRDLLEATGWLPRRVREVRDGALAARKCRAVREIMHSPAMHADPTDDILTLSVESVVQGLGCIPVVESGRLVGILTERDLLRAYVQTVSRAASDCTEPQVEDLMTCPVRSIQLTATLREAREACRTWGVRHLPVLDATHLVGMLSDRDLRRAHGCARRDDYPIAELMTPRPATVAPGAPISEAARLLLSRRCSAVPVVADDELVGILTVEDLFDPCMRFLPR